MSPKTFCLLLSISLVYAILPHTLQSKPVENPFGFIQNLEGFHKGQSIKGVKNLKKYLEKFGYLNYDYHKGNNHANDDDFDDHLEKAIKDYQHFYHLKETGILDNSTVSQMMKPRYGVADVRYVNGTTEHLHNRKLMSIRSSTHYKFFNGQPKWPAEKSHLRYRFRSSVTVPGTENIRSICERAFQKWTQVSHFTFEEVGSDAEAEIEIGFHRGSHGDISPFDGREGAIAHAYAPTKGDMHYDADENWSENPTDQQVDLESTSMKGISLFMADHE